MTVAAPACRRRIKGRNGMSFENKTVAGTGAHGNATGIPARLHRFQAPEKASRASRRLRQTRIITTWILYQEILYLALPPLDAANRRTQLQWRKQCPTRWVFTSAPPFPLAPHHRPVAGPTVTDTPAITAPAQGEMSLRVGIHRQHLVSSLVLRRLWSLR